MDLYYIVTRTVKIAKLLMNNPKYHKPAYVGFAGDKVGALVTQHEAENYRVTFPIKFKQN